MANIPDIILKVEVDTSELEKALERLKQAVDEDRIRAIVADEVRKQLEARDNALLPTVFSGELLNSGSQG